MKSLTATGAAAAVALITAAGAALALPPPPASAPRGAHVAAPPPDAGTPAPGAANATPGLTPGNSSEPIDITSEGVEVLQPQHLTIFKGNVEETQGTQRLRTPELRVYYKAKQQTPGQPAAAQGAAFGADQTGGIDHIEAAGPVYYITPTQNARGDYMTYVKDTNIITLTGHVVLTQGKDVAKGDKLVMNRTTGQNQLFSNSPNTPQGRVRVILYPQQGQQPGAPAAAKPPAAH
jgi:lipopolysaccharide export system protein LptA